MVPALTDTPTTITPDQRAPHARSRIAALIRSELVAGHLGAGSRLPSERALAEQFGVSRNTLREALRALAEEDFPRRAEKNNDFNHILTRMTGNPIMVVIVNGVLDVLREFIRRSASTLTTMCWRRAGALSPIWNAVTPKPRCPRWRPFSNGCSEATCHD